MEKLQSLKVDNLAIPPKTAFIKNRMGVMGWTVWFRGFRMMLLVGIAAGRQSAAAVIQERLYPPVFSRPRLKRVEFYNPVKSSHITALTGGW